MAFFHDKLSSLPPEVQHNLKQAAKETAAVQRQLQIVESKLADAHRAMHLPLTDMNWTSSAPSNSQLPFSLQTNSVYSHLPQPKRRFVHEKNRLASKERLRRGQSVPEMDVDEKDWGSDRFDDAPRETAVDDEANEADEAVEEDVHIQRQQSQSPPPVQKSRRVVTSNGRHPPENRAEIHPEHTTSQIPMAIGPARHRPRVFSRPLAFVQTDSSSSDPPQESQLPHSTRIEEIRKRFEETKKASTAQATAAGHTTGGASRSQNSRRSRSSSEKSAAHSSSLSSSSLSHTSDATSSAVAGRSKPHSVERNRLGTRAVEKTRPTTDVKAAAAVNRRIVSPPIKRRKEAVAESAPVKEAAGTSTTSNKKHSYNADVLQAYMELKRRERKRHLQVATSSNPPQHKERHHDSEKVRAFIEKKKKEQKSALSAVKRRHEDLVAAKADRVERVIEEQKKRSGVSAAHLLLEGLLFDPDSSTKHVDIEGIRERHARRLENIGNTPEEMLANWAKDRRGLSQATQTPETKRESTAQTDLENAPIARSADLSFDKTVQTDAPVKPAMTDQALSPTPSDHAHSPLDHPSQRPFFSTPIASTTIGAESGWIQLEGDTEVETGDVADSSAFRSPPDPYNVVNTIARKAQLTSSWQNASSQPTTPATQRHLQEEAFHTPASALPARKTRSRRFDQAAILATSTPQGTPVKGASLDSADGEFFDARDRSFDSPLRPAPAALQQETPADQQRRQAAPVEQSAEQLRSTAQALGSRLTAGIDYLDSVNRSMQQVQQVERLFEVSDARQQAASAAYLLKAQEAREDEKQLAVDRERDRSGEIQRDVLRLIAEENERRAHDAEQQRNNWSRVAADAAASATAAVLSALESRQRYESARRRRRSPSKSASHSSSQDTSSSSVLQLSPSAPAPRSGNTLEIGAKNEPPTAVPSKAAVDTTEPTRAHSNSISTELDNDISDSAASRSVQSPKARPSSSSESASLSSWAEEKREFGHNLVQRARHLAATDQSSRRKLIHQRIEALKNYFSAQILVIHEQKRLLKSLPRGQDQIPSLNAKQDRLSVEYKQLKRQARNSIDDALAERDFASMQLREIARLQSLTLHQQWQLERLGGSEIAAVDTLQHLAPLTSYQTLDTILDNDEFKRTREQQLEKRRVAAERLLKLGRDLERKERQVVSLERRATTALFQSQADKSDGRGSRIGSDHKKSSRANAVSTSTTTSTSESSKPSSSTTQSIPSVPMQIRLDEPKSSESIQDEGSVVGTTQQTSSSVSEQAVTAQKTSESESTSQVPTVGASSSSTTSKTSSKTTIKEAASDRSKSESSSSLSDRRKSWPNRRHKSQSKDVDSMSASFSGDTEIETRIQALKANLAEKRQLASKLKREHNRRTKEHLISTEQSLAKQIEAYDKYIKQTQDTLYDLEKSTVSGSISRPGTPPRIRSPRTSLEGSRQGSPTKIVSPRRVPGSPTKGSFDWNHSAEVVDEVGEESLVKAVDSSESIPTAIPSATTHTSSSKTTSTSKTSSTSTTTSSSTSTSKSPSSSSEKREKSAEKAAVENVGVAVDAKVERVLSPPFVPPLLEEQQSLKEASLKHSGSLGDELDEEDRRTENDVSSLSDEAEPEALESSSSVEERVVADDTATKDVTTDEPLNVNESASSDNEVSKRHLVRQPSTDVDEQQPTGPIRPPHDDRKERLTDEIFKQALDDALDEAARVAKIKQNSMESDAVIDRATFDRFKQLASGQQLASSHLHELPSPRSSSLSPRQPRDRFMAIATHSPRSPGASGHVKSPRQLFDLDIPALDVDKSIGEHSIGDHSIGDHSIPELLGEEWMDDDLHKADVNIPQVSSARAPVPSSAFTQDVFSAVPCERTVLTQIVSGVADHLWQRRRFGEPLNQHTYPENIFSLPIDSFSLDRSIAADSDRAFRTMLCDWCAEMTTELFADDQAGDEGVAPAKLKVSRLARVRPRSAAELASVLEAHVLERLLPPPTAERKKTRVHVVSRRRLERVDEILLEEMYDEEPHWVDYDRDEYALKLELSEQIWGAVLNEAIDDCLLQASNVADQ